MKLLGYFDHQMWQQVPCPAAAASVVNALAEFLPPVKRLRDRFPVVLVRPLKRGNIWCHPGNVRHARDLNSTRLLSVLAFFVPRRGKPGDEAKVCVFVCSPRRPNSTFVYYGHLNKQVTWNGPKGFWIRGVPLYTQCAYVCIFPSAKV